MSSVVITENLEAVEARIGAACSRAGRSRSEVLLVAVSKTFPASAIDAAVAAGVTDVGENRVQELRDKHSQLRSVPRIHLIGHLQSNKVRDAVRLVDVVQSIDTLELARKLDRAASAANRRLAILLQVNVGGETQKSGLASGEIDAVADEAVRLPALDLIGVMAIPPQGDEESTRGWFRKLRRDRDRLRERHAGIRELSMGMTDDFEIAIEEGATMVRVGRAIFGERS